MAKQSRKKQRSISARLMARGEGAAEAKREFDSMVKNVKEDALAAIADDDLETLVQCGYVGLVTGQPYEDWDFGMNPKKQTDPRVRLYEVAFSKAAPRCVEWLVAEAMKRADMGAMELFMRCAMVWTGGGDPREKATLTAVLTPGFRLLARTPKLAYVRPTVTDANPALLPIAAQVDAELLAEREREILEECAAVPAGPGRADIGGRL